MISIALSLTAKIGATRNYKQLLAAAENARTLNARKKTWADIRSAGKVRCGNDVTRFDAAKDDAERTVYRKQRNRRWPPSPFHIEERALARVASLSELDAAVAALVQQRVAALFVAPQADFRNWRQQILALAERNALPTSFSNSDFVVAGGLMSYGPNQIESYREAGIYTGRILKGERPAELPVLVSTKFNFAINLKTAKALGLTIPPSMLALTTTLIE
jgi:hypothetical protein